MAKKYAQCFRFANALNFELKFLTGHCLLSSLNLNALPSQDSELQRDPLPDRSIE